MKNPTDKYTMSIQNDQACVKAMKDAYGGVVSASFDSSVSPTSLYDLNSALRLLRSYNQFILPPPSAQNSETVPNVVGPLLAAIPSGAGCLPSYCQHLPLRTIPPLLATPPCENDIRRSRGEKRPIPQELKDEKYYERRRRNNQAAKKSRDARRIREDQIAWRACLLEQENASLRAHIASLRQETLTLRALLAASHDSVTSTTSDCLR